MLLLSHDDLEWSLREYLFKMVFLKVKITQDIGISVPNCPRIDDLIDFQCATMCFCSIFFFTSRVKP